MVFKRNQETELNESFESETLLKEIIAFLNTCDGRIYIGVKDDGRILGVDDIDEISKKISTIASRKIEPSAKELVNVETLTFPEGKVIAISVKRCGYPRYIKRLGMSSSDGCYERVGTSIRKMEPEQMRRRMIPYIKSKVKITDLPSSRKDLSFKMLKFLYDEEGIRVNRSSFCKDEGFYTEEGEYNILAELLADESKFSIKVTRFLGKSKADDVSFRNEYGYKCLIVAMKNAYSFCADLLNMRKTLFNKGWRGEDVPLFDKDAFREAWCNATLHNDWIGGNTPAIYIFDDRLEIISTGGLPLNMRKDEFFAGVHKPVNEPLEKVFKKLALVHAKGNGVKTIIGKYGEEAFSFSPSFLNVTIPFNYSLREFIL